MLRACSVKALGVILLGCAIAMYALLLLVATETHASKSMSSYIVVPSKDIAATVLHHAIHAYTWCGVTAACLLLYILLRGVSSSSGVLSLMLLLHM